MKLPEMRAGLTISAAAHAALLLWGLVSFSARPLEAAQPAMPIDIVSDKEFSKIAAGVKNAPPAETSKALVEKVGETKPSDEPAPKVSEKQEIKTASAPPPEPETKPAEAKPEKEKKEPPKVDQIAEALKKEEIKRKRDEAKAKALEEKKKRKEAQQPKFDPKQIAALLDKRDPRRQAATGERLSEAPSLGIANAMPAQLSQGELDAMRSCLHKNWNVPVGGADVANLKVLIRVLFKRDGTVAAPPTAVMGSASPYGPTLADSAKRAIWACQPFKMLKPQNYEIWKDMEIMFDPKEMFGT